MTKDKTKSGGMRIPKFIDTGEFEAGRHYYLLDDKGGIVRDADGNAACGEPRSNPEQEFHIATCLGEFAVEFGEYNDDGEPLFAFEPPYPVVAIPYKAGHYPGHSGFYIRPDAYHCPVGEVMEDIYAREKEGIDNEEEIDNDEPKAHIANCHPDFRDIPLIIPPPGKRPKYNRPVAAFADICGNDIARPGSAAKEG